MKSGSKEVEHFTGTIVYQESGGSFKKAFLVDGQQRVTTVILIIKALSLITASKKDADSDYAEYTTNCVCDFKETS